MHPPSNSTSLETLPSGGRVHVVGAGPVGLMLTALLQSMEGYSVRLYEKRREYTRTRMVQLASYLVADSVEAYRTDSIDADSIEAIFEPQELEKGLRRLMARYSASSRSFGYPWICTGLAMRPTGSGSQRVPRITPSPARRCSSPAIRPSVRRTFSRSRLVSSARCIWQSSSRGVTCP